MHLQLTRLIALFMVYVVSLQAATCTTTGNATASSSTNWSCGHIPTTGDTVAIATGHTVTADTNWTFGDDSTASAYSNAINSTGTGKLVVNTGVTVNVKGGMLFECGTTGGVVGVTLSGGSSLLTDHSTSAYANGYKILFGAHCVLNTSGTSSASKATIGTSDTTASGKRPEFNQSPFDSGTSGPHLDADWLVLKNLSTGTFTAGTTGSAQHDVNRCFDCSNTGGTGSLTFIWASADAKHRFKRFAYESLPSSIAIRFTPNATYSFIDGNSYFMDGKVGDGRTASKTALFFDGYTPMEVSGNLLGGKVWGANGTTGTKIGPERFRYNMIASRTVGDPWNGPDFQYNYWVNDEAAINARAVSLDPRVPGFTFSNNIIMVVGGGNAAQGSGDIVFGNGDQVNTALFTGNVLEPTVNGYAPGKFLSWIGALNGGVPMCGKYQVDNNMTVSTQPNFDAEGGLIGTGEIVGGSYGDCPAGGLVSVRSNLVWTPSAYTASYYSTLLQRWHSATQDYLSSSNVSSNWLTNPIPAEDPTPGVFRFSGTSRTTTFFTSGTPALAGTGDARIVDQYRSYPYASRSFFEKLYGVSHTVIGEWADATAYSVGDIVTATTSGMWNGHSILMRCVTAHTSAAGNATNGKPDSSTSISNWRANWQYATWGDLWNRPDLVRPYVAWAMKGWYVQNGALRRAGYSGSTIGVGFDGCKVQSGLSDSCVSPVVF